MGSSFSPLRKGGLEDFGAMTARRTLPDVIRRVCVRMETGVSP